MPDDSPAISLTERYYINKRMDSIEKTMAEGFQDIHESIKDIRVAIKESNEQTLTLFKDCQKNCTGEVEAVKVEVKGLTGYKNRAIGAIGLILLLIGIWKYVSGVT